MLLGGKWYHPHFTDAEVKAQRGLPTLGSLFLYLPLAGFQTLFTEKLFPYHKR